MLHHPQRAVLFVCPGPLLAPGVRKVFKPAYLPFVYNTKAPNLQGMTRPNPEFSVYSGTLYLNNCNKWIKRTCNMTSSELDFTRRTSARQTTKRHPIPSNALFLNQATDPPPVRRLIVFRRLTEE
jgi:hypothetical protein